MADPDHIACWQRIDARITTSGRLEAGDIAALAALGVRHVINLALAEHPQALSGEADLLAAQGIAYSHIPVPFDAPGQAHFDAFCRALAAEDGALHIHCIMNWRVSAFLYRWHRAVSGMAEDKARAIMARQWQPEASDHPDAAAWARFIAS